MEGKKQGKEEGKGGEVEGGEAEGREGGEVERMEGGVRGINIYTFHHYLLIVSGDEEFGSGREFALVFVQSDDRSYCREHWDICAINDKAMALKEGKRKVLT